MTLSAAEIDRAPGRGRPDPARHPHRGAAGRRRRSTSPTRCSTSAAARRSTCSSADRRTLTLPHGPLVRADGAGRPAVRRRATWWSPTTAVPSSVVDADPDRPPGPPRPGRRARCASASAAAADRDAWPSTYFVGQWDVTVVRVPGRPRRARWSARPTGPAGRRPGPRGGRPRSAAPARGRRGWHPASWGPAAPVRVAPTDARQRPRCSSSASTPSWRSPCSPPAAA